MFFKYYKINKLQFNINRNNKILLIVRLDNYPY